MGSYSWPAVASVGIGALGFIVGLYWTVRNWVNATTVSKPLADVKATISAIELRLESVCDAHRNLISRMDQLGIQAGRLDGQAERTTTCKAERTRVEADFEERLRDHQVSIAAIRQGLELCCKDIEFLKCKAVTDLARLEEVAELIVRRVMGCYEK